MKESYTLNKTLRETDKMTAVAEERSSRSLDCRPECRPHQLPTMARLPVCLAGMLILLLDIRKGDSFKVIYEDLYLDGKKIGTGDILAAEFTNQGQTHKAIRFTHDDGGLAIMTRMAIASKKPLRSPIDFARISSHFSLNRKHPVLYRFRAHKGTDYAAARGTPIKSTGDGKVLLLAFRVVTAMSSFCSTDRITTLYGHMNAFARGCVQDSHPTRTGHRLCRFHRSCVRPSLPLRVQNQWCTQNPVTVALPRLTPCQPRKGQPLKAGSSRTGKA